MLERRIPGFQYRDAMGGYPLFACQDWSQLKADLDDLDKDLVSLALVADPFGIYDTKLLNHAFPDVVIHYKNHYVVDLSCTINEIVSRHHRYYARKDLKSIKVEVCRDPIHFIDDWVSTYETLIERHNLRGIKKCSRVSFLKQLSVPGIVMFRAVYENSIIGAGAIILQDTKEKEVFSGKPADLLPISSDDLPLP